MSTQDLPSILVIDDEEDVRPIANRWREDGLAKVEVLPPEEVELRNLKDVDLVLVDFHIGSWKDTGTELPIGQKPPDGLALAAVLRRYLSKDHYSNAECPPTAFAILTGQISKLTEPLPPDYKHHAIARMTNLEWIFEKSSSQLETQVTGLANAVKKLPRNWLPDKDGASLNQLLELLGIDSDASDRLALVDDVLGCLPPLHELSEWSHGLALLRWFLHRILPYPCFLLDVHYLAARLRVDVVSLREALKPGQPLAEAFDTCKYTGILCDFLGDRWWRSKVEALLWEKTEGRSFDIDDVDDLIKLWAGDKPPSRIFVTNPVVCIDEHFQAMEQFVSIEDAIRIRPDDWPAFADQAWTTVFKAKEDIALKSVVIADDKERLE